MLNNIDILIIEDDANICANLNDILSEDGYKIASTGTISLAKKKLTNKFYNIALLDIKLPDGSGLELIKEIKKINEDIIVIVMTGFASVESSITALNEGAFAYLQKPLNMDEVKVVMQKALKMQKLAIDNKFLLKKLKTLSLKDPLTGLYNYRYLEERLSAEFKRAKRNILPISIIMIDIDYFKSINDTYGHQCGDAILKELAVCLTDHARANDIVVRYYGGDEFLFLLPDTNKEEAVIIGKRLIEKIKKHNFQSKIKKVKISIGISNFPEDGVNTEANLLNLADAALGDAKEMGGNNLSVSKGVFEENVENIIEKNEKENVKELKEKLFKMKNRVNHTLLESIYAFARAIKAKDNYTSEHSENMVYVVTEIGKRFNLSNKEIENLRHAAILHDLGKIGIPDKILLKHGKLTKKEYEKIKKHPQIGAEIIRCIHFLEEIVPIILYHHERFDGLGYSLGLKGKDIPLAARIISVVDVYQALILDRPYRKAYNKKEALRAIESGSGTQFDPDVVKVFLEIMRSKKNS